MQARLATLHERAPCFSFTTPEARELATTALTHASVSPTRNNLELAKVGEALRLLFLDFRQRNRPAYRSFSYYSKMGKAVAIEALFLSPGVHGGKLYNDISACFSKKRLCEIAKSLKLDELMRLDKGVPFVSEEMYARALEALLGALHLAHGHGALLQALRDLDIVKAPDVPPELSGEET